MKKVLVGLSLSLAALGLLMAPAMAVASSPNASALSASDQAFLSSLAARGGTPAPVLSAKEKAVGEKSSCNATANCGGGVSITCNGVSTCSGVDRNCAASEPGHVICDGTPTSCTPACPPPACDCAALRSECLENCSPCGFTFSCNATTCVNSCRCRITPSCNL